MHPDIQKIRKQYLDKFEGFPPYIGEDAYKEYIKFLEDYIVKLKDKH